MNHIAIILNEHIDILHTSATTQLTTLSISCFIGRFMPETNMPQMQISSCTDMRHLYPSYELSEINNVTRHTGIHTCNFTTRICSQQICLQQCTHMSHCTATVVYIHIQHHCTYHSKKTFLSHATAIYVPATKMPLKCHIYATCMKYSMCIMGGYANTYATQEFLGINHVTWSTVHRWHVQMT